MIPEPLKLWLIGWMGAAALQAGLWLWQLATRNATAVDAGWSASIGLIAAFYAYAGMGEPDTRLLMLGVAGVWSVRLTLHLVLDRLIPHGLGPEGEDRRYRALREHWGPSPQVKFFVLYQAQALLAAALTLPFLLMAFDPRPGLSPVEWVGLGLWFVAVAGESIADRQLARFRRNPAHKGVTCRAGLWRYSRHPNYFFEWVIWVSFAVMASTSPYGWAAAAAPILMYIFIVHVTGIPFAEMQAIKSRGDDYRRYQRETSAFVPWFPRRDPA